MSANNNNNNNTPVRYRRRTVKKDELNLSKIFKILKRRKFWFGAIVGTALLIAGLYSFLADPVYEASVLLKKEKQEKQVTKDDLNKILSLQTLDEVETEVALVKTWDVLAKVAEELDLNINVEKFVPADGSVVEIEKNILDYRDKYLTRSGSYPDISASLTRSDKSYNLVAVKKENNVYELYEAGKKNLIDKVQSDSSAVFHVNDFLITIDWSNAMPNSRVYFTAKGYNKTLKDLSNRISVDHQEKTNVFKVAVEASNPYAAEITANTLTDKFRESRIDQQKQTIHYSFKFVDDQLEKIQDKLVEAERNLTEYKSTNEIMDISGSSESLVRFLSDLEAEKLRTELELAQFKNKLSGMTDKKGEDGYFDQTFLAPHGNDPTNSPFSQLLSQQSNLELKRLELLEKRTETHPDVVAIDMQLKTVSEKLAQYNDNTLSSYSIIISSLQKKENEIENMLGKYESKMRVLPQHENKLASLIRQTNVYSKMYTLLLDKREEMRMAELSKLQDIVIVDPANKPNEPISPRKQFNMIAGLVIGSVFGFIGIFIVEARSKRKVQLDDVEDDFRFPIFAIIPNYSRDIRKKISGAVNYESKFVTLMDEQDGFRESFRVLRTKINSHFNGENKFMMFTSCEENTGKTSIVANLAISTAHSNKKVLVVDCDLKKGTLSRLLNIPKDAPGLIQYLEGSAGTPFIYNKIDKNLDILPAGGVSEDSSDLLTSNRIQKLYNMLQNSEYDYVIFDTPPVTRVVDALILGKIVKDAVLILRPEHTFKDSVKWGIKEMEHSEIDIIGTVINAGEIEKSSFKYRYGYGYGYGNYSSGYKNAYRLGA